MPLCETNRVSECTSNVDGLGGVSNVLVNIFVVLGLSVVGGSVLGQNTKERTEFQPPANKSINHES